MGKISQFPMNTNLKNQQKAKFGQRRANEKNSYIKENQK